MIGIIVISTCNRWHGIRLCDTVYKYTHWNKPHNYFNIGLETTLRIQGHSLQCSHQRIRCLELCNFKEKRHLLKMKFELSFCNLSTCTGIH